MSSSPGPNPKSITAPTRFFLLKFCFQRSFRIGIKISKAVFLLFLGTYLTFRGSKWLAAERAAFWHFWKLPRRGLTAVYTYFHFWRSFYRAVFRFLTGRRTSHKWPFMLEFAMEFLTIPSYKYIIDAQYGSSTVRFVKELVFPVIEALTILDARTEEIAKLLFPSVRIQQHPSAAMPVHLKCEGLKWIDFPKEDEEQGMFSGIGGKGMFSGNGVFASLPFVGGLGAAAGGGLASGLQGGIGT